LDTISFIQSELDKLNSIQVSATDRQQQVITTLSKTDKHENITVFKTMIMNMIKFILNAIKLDKNVYIHPFVNTIYNKFVYYIDDEKVTNIDTQMKDNFKNILLNNICYLRYISATITDISKDDITYADDETKALAKIIAAVIQTKMNLIPGTSPQKPAIPIIFDYEEEDFNSHLTNLIAEFK
jgi:hypothetical protein